MSAKDTIQNLREREKELNCLYKVHEILRDEESPLDHVLRKLIQVIPEGWQFSGICTAKAEVEGIVATSPGYHPTKWFQTANILVEGSNAGFISVFYREMVRGKEPAFLAEEQQLLNTIAREVSQHIFNRRLKETLEYLNEKKEFNIHSKDRLLAFKTEEHWKWRKEMAGRIAELIDMDAFGLEAIYLIGSAKEATSGPGSDIDLLVHFTGDEAKKEELKSFMLGWGMCLSQINYEKTGVWMENMVDLHILTTKDIETQENSFAAMIGSKTNAAKLLKRKK